MAETVTTKVRIKGDTKQAVAEARRLEGQMGKLGKGVKATSDQLGSLQKAMGAFGLIATAMAAARELDSLATRAVETSNVFGALKISVDAAAEAVGHQTTKIELAKSANKLHAAGIKLTEQEYARLAGTVAALADAQGQDLDTAINKVTKSLVTGTDRGLSALGITVDLEEAQRELGRTMTKRERQEFIYQATLNEGTIAATENGIAINGLGQRWHVAKNKLSDMVDQVISQNNAMEEGITTTDALLVSMGPLGAWMEVNIQAFESFTDETREFSDAFERAGNVVEAFNRKMERTNTQILKVIEAQNKFFIGERQKDLLNIHKINLQKRAELERGKKKRGPRKKQKTIDELVNEASGPTDEFTEFGASDAFEAEITGEYATAVERLTRVQEQNHAANLEAQQQRRERVDSMQRELEVAAAMGASKEELLNREIMIAEFEGKEHEAKLLRIERDMLATEDAERRKQESFALTAQISRVSADITTQTMDLAVKALGLSGEKAVQIQEKVDGAKMFIRAAVESVEAAAAFARYDFVAFGAHAAAATLATIQGGLIISGALRKGGSAGSVVAGGRPATGIGEGLGGGGGSGGATDAPSIPISPVDEDLARTNGSGRRPQQGGGKSGGTTNITVLGATEAQVGTALRRVLKNTDRNAGAQL